MHLDTQLHGLWVHSGMLQRPEQGRLCGDTSPRAESGCRTGRHTGDWTQKSNVRRRPSYQSEIPKTALSFETQVRNWGQSTRRHKVWYAMKAARHRRSRLVARANKRFWELGNQSLRQLHGGRETVQGPSAKEVESYWKGLVGVQGSWTTQQSRPGNRSWNTSP